MSLKSADSYRFPSPITRRILGLVIGLAFPVVGYLLSGAGVWAAALSPAAQVESELDAQTVHYPSSDASIEAYLAKPKTGGQHPAIIVVHDDQGLTQGTRDVTQLFARAGFVVLAPNLTSRLGNADAAAKQSAPDFDLFSRRTPVSALSVYQTVDDVKAAFTFLQNDPGVDETRISVVGIGWGGWRAYRLAEDVPTVHRVVIFYGVTPDDGHVNEIQAPVLAHYAQHDFLVTASSLTAHKWLGKKFTYYIYPNTDRGFFGGGNTGLDVAALSGEVDLEAAAREKARQAASSGGVANSVATPDAAKLALDRTLAFLRN